MQVWLIGFILSCASVMALPPSSPVYDVADPPQGVFYDEWMEIQMNGEKVGYSNARYWRDGDRVYTQNDSYIRIGRVGVSVEMTMQLRTEETVDGEPLNIDSLTVMGKQPVQMKASVEGDSVNVHVNQAGREVSNSYPFPRQTVSVWGTTRESLLQGFKPGTSYSLLMYSPDMLMQAPFETHIHVRARESVDYYGESLELTRVTMRMESGMLGVNTVSWVDDYGRVIKTAISMGGMPMEMYAVSKEKALQDFDTAEGFMDSMIDLGRAIPRDASRVHYLLERRDGETFQALPITALQEVRMKDGKAYVTVTGARSHEFPDLVGVTQDEKYLASSAMMDLEDSKLRKLFAKSKAEKESQPIKAARKLTAFVSEFIEDKNLGVGFATASEVCRYPEGDCSEHAVLLAALGRLAGIPSRIAAGLAYVPEIGGRQNVMGYHMWTQFYVNGEWIDFDASIYEKKGVSPCRIALAVSALEDASLGDIGMPLIDMFGNINVSIISLEE